MRKYLQLKNLKPDMFLSQEIFLLIIVHTPRHFTNAKKVEYTINLHENRILFARLINFTANKLNINPEFVEKDYWITLILNRLSQSPHANNVVFKGGTSLTKGYRLINRLWYEFLEEN